MTTVCLIVQNYYESDVRVRRKAEALVSAGYSVDVLAMGSGRVDYVMNGVNVLTLQLGKRRGSLLRYLFEYMTFFIWAAFRVTRLMRRRRYAVIDVNTLPDFLVFAPAVARWMGAAIVLDMHEITPEFYMSKYGIGERSWVIRILTYLERISFDYADRVLTINEPIEDLLVSRGLDRSKSTIVMNSADEAQLGSARPDEVAGEPFIMMYHGTLTPLYGLDIAVEAFAIAHQDMPGAELRILGSGPESARLRTLVAERGLTSKVKLVGQVPASEIPTWLRQCTVGVLPIRRDVFLDFAFPNKLPEFILAGKPVLISSLRSIRHYFSDDALAFCEANDPAALAAQMVRLFNDPQLRRRLAARAQQEYVPIRWEVMKQRYLSVVADVAAAVSSSAVAANPLPAAELRRDSAKR
jgi:glycosyltransferase involved in cell wall biosynthesis